MKVKIRIEVDRRAVTTVNAAMSVRAAQSGLGNFTSLNADTANRKLLPRRQWTPAAAGDRLSGSFQGLSSAYKKFPTEFLSSSLAPPHRASLSEVTP